MKSNHSSKFSICMVATVGGSLIINLQKALKETAVQKKIFGLGSILQKLLLAKKINSLESEQLMIAIAPFLNQGQRYLQAGDVRWRLAEEAHANKQASAEIQSICQYIDQHLVELESIQVYLLATDTPLSKIAGTLIAHQLGIWYPQFFSGDQAVQLRPIENLRLDKLTEFNSIGLNNLLQEIYNINAPLKDHQRLLINMTGGYKGTIPVLCLAAQLLGGQLLYGYEYQKLPEFAQNDLSKKDNYPSGPLLEIPSIGIHFFWDFLEACQPLLNKMEERQKGTLLELTAAELEGIEQNLVPAGICQSSHYDYRPTALGKILGKLVEQKTPVGKSVLGYMIAFKVFEYLLEEPWAGYQRVRQGYYFPAIKDAPARAGFQFQDVDILLGDPADQWEWVEVKSYAKVCFAFKRGDRKSYKEQLKNQMLAWQNQGLQPPKAYHLYFYRHPFHALDRAYLITNLQKIKAFLKKNGISEFRVFYFTLDLDASDWFVKKENPYTAKLASRKLTREKAKYQKQLASINLYDKYLLVQEFLVPIRES